MQSIVVLGSANADLYVELLRLPKEGETLPATAGGELRPGGKGANQSAAASLLGLRTFFIGQVGEDAAGQMLEKELIQRNVQLDYINRLGSIPSGQAIVILLPSAQNSIIIIGGANQAWNSFPASMIPPINASQALLLQREIPDQVNFEAATYAKSQNKLVIMDAGGKLGPIPDDMLKIIDILSPNTLEIEEISGVKNDLEAAGRVILSKGVKHLVIKLSTEGSLYLGVHGTYKQNIFNKPGLQVVDTTGAGDCYTAALVSKLIELGTNCTLEDFKIAMQFASVAAFLSVTRKGAMESMPTLEEINKICLG